MVPSVKSELCIGMITSARGAESKTIVKAAVEPFSEVDRPDVGATVTVPVAVTPDPVGFTVSVIELFTVPVLFTHEISKVSVVVAVTVKGPTNCDPEDAIEPDHAFDAVQVAESVDTQEIVATLPETIVFGLIEKVDIVGAGTTVPPPPPPVVHPDIVRWSMRLSHA